MSNLLADRRDHARVPVPGVDDGDAGEAVDVLGAVRVPDPRAFGPFDDDRFDRGDETCRHELLGIWQLFDRA